jgi:hypothetical protein
MRVSINSVATRLLIIGTLAVAVFTGFHKMAHADNSAALHDAIGYNAVVNPSSIKLALQTKEAVLDAEFKKFDLNNDEKISFREAVKNKIFSKQFVDADINQDGGVSKNEYAEYKTRLTSNTVDGVETATP